MTRVLRSLLVRVDSREIELSSSAQSLQCQDLPALVYLQNHAIPFSSSRRKEDPGSNSCGGTVAGGAASTHCKHAARRSTSRCNKPVHCLSVANMSKPPSCGFSGQGVALLCVAASSDQSTAIGRDTGRWPLRQRGSPSNRTWPPESKSRIVTPNAVAITGLREHLSQFCGFSVEEAGNAQRIAARLWRTLPWQAPP
jgi:hypothetical protein